MKDIIQEGKWDEDANGKRWEDYETILCPNGQVISMIELLKEQHKAMAALNHLAPELGGLIGSLRMIYTFKVNTQATDCGTTIFINPQFTYNLDFTGKVFVMAHEVMHCLLNHGRRGEGHDHERSNIAADYEVNDTLVSMDLFKEQTIKNLKGYIDMKYANMGYEEIYKIINQSAPDTMSNQQQASQAQKNQNQSQNQSQSQSGSGSRSGGGGNSQQYSDTYKENWAKAIADYEAGLIEI